MKIRWVLLTGLTIYLSLGFYRNWDIEHGPREDGGYDLAGLLAKNGRVNVRELYGDDVTEIQFYAYEGNFPLSPEICDHSNSKSKRYSQVVAIIRKDKCEVYEFKSFLRLSVDYGNWSASVDDNTVVIVDKSQFMKDIRVIEEGKN